MTAFDNRKKYEDSSSESRETTVEEKQSMLVGK